MGQSVFPAPAAGKTRRLLTLTSGTSWTVPATITFVNVTLRGGGGGGGSGINAANAWGFSGLGGQIVSSTLATTPGASISYAIGAGGTGPTAANTLGGTGGTTTFTGATSAVGGNGGNTAAGVGPGPVGTSVLSANNGGGGGSANAPTTIYGGAGGSGSIDIEYWV
jgi:hypothetical protein